MGSSGDSEPRRFLIGLWVYRNADGTHKVELQSVDERVHPETVIMYLKAFLRKAELEFFKRFDAEQAKAG